MQKDMNHPWLQPVWVRLLLVVICGLVALWDISRGDFGWALIFGGMGAYAYYIFFVVWYRDRTDATTDKSDDEADPGDRK